MLKNRQTKSDCLDISVAVCGFKCICVSSPLVQMVRGNIVEYSTFFYVHKLAVNNNIKCVWQHCIEMILSKVLS